MSETTPLNEWPVERLRDLKHVLQMYKGVTIADCDYYKMLETIKAAIKDAEEKLNELPFK